MNPREDNDGQQGAQERQETQARQGEEARDRQQGEEEIGDEPTDEALRIGEVIEASTSQFVAECYALYEVPPFGSLVQAGDGPGAEYGIVCNATTASIEPGRRPIARGRDEASEDAVYQSSPQLARLLRSEFTALVVGYGDGDQTRQYLPPGPARIHGFVYLCSSERAREFSRSLDFLNLLLTARLPVSVEELVAACLRQMARAHDDGRGFLIGAGRELATLLSGDFGRLRAIIKRIEER